MGVIGCIANDIQEINSHTVYLIYTTRHSN